MLRRRPRSTPFPCTSPFRPRSTRGKRHVYRRRSGMAAAIGRCHRLATCRLQGHAVAEGVYTVVSGYEGVIPRQQRLSIRTGSEDHTPELRYDLIVLFELILYN